MDVKAIHRRARISPQKAREVAREIQGMDVSQALALLNYTPRKAALMFGRTLQSAIANATHNHQLDEETLFVKSCTATDGGMMKRFMPRARGSAAPIRKRMAHLTVVVAPRVTAEGDAAAKGKASKKAEGDAASSSAEPAKTRRKRAAAKSAE